MTPIYMIPFVAWFIGGCTKFLVNSLKSQSLAFAKIGYGGWPSNHATIVSSTASFLLFKHPSAPEYSLVAITLGFIVCMDAMGQRKHMELQAQLLKELAHKSGVPAEQIRTTLAHKPFEVISGIILGVVIGYVFFAINI